MPKIEYVCGGRKVYYPQNVLAIILNLTPCHCVCLYCSWADAATNLSHISGGFDQETAAGVMARLAVQK